MRDEGLDGVCEVFRKAREIRMTEERKSCLQPEYVSHFRCDGASCGAQCCRKWNIDIDAGTYQKYCGIEPIAERKRITSKLKFHKEKNGFRIRLRRDGACPFLGEDLLCELQKNHGPQFLSKICREYPRINNIVGNLAERCMTITCPVAAKLILLQRDPMTFEEVPVPEMDFIRLKLTDEIGHKRFDVQYGGISILQNRRLRIDQRLIVLGFFLEQADDLLREGKSHQWATLSEIYTSEEFMQEVPSMLQAVKFSPYEYVRAMLGMIESLYGKNAKFFGRHEYLDYVTETLSLGDTTHASLTVMKDRYLEKCHPVRAWMLDEFSYLLENYLVNEFFLNVYPFRVHGTCALNYKVFLLTYKLAEFVLVSMASVKERQISELDIVQFFSDFSNRVDHTEHYLDEIVSATSKQSTGIDDLMKALLDAEI